MAASAAHVMPTCNKDWRGFANGTGCSWHASVDFFTMSVPMS